MNEAATSFPPVLFGVMAVFAVLAAPLILGYLGRKLFSRPAPLPYIPCDKLVSDHEWTFYKALKQALPEKMHICLKVRLGDIIRCPDKISAKMHGAAIAAQHVDFVLVHEGSAKIALCIEVDDGPLGFFARLKRNPAFVDRAMASAGIPFIRVEPKGMYNVASLRRQLIDRIYQRPQFA